MHGASIWVKMILNWCFSVTGLPLWILIAICGGTAVVYSTLVRAVPEIILGGTAFFSKPFHPQDTHGRSQSPPTLRTSPSPLWIKYALTPGQFTPPPPLGHVVNNTPSPPTGQKSACGPLPPGG